MTDDKPVIYILHGDDPVEVARFVEAMVAKVAESGMADLNLSRMDARNVSEADLRTAVFSLPFLSERRLVILEEAQARLTKAGEEQFKALLDRAPESTALVLIVRDEYVSGGSRRGWQNLPAKHWIWQWIDGADGRVFYRACQQPAQDAMSGWIRQKAESLGGRFTPGAAMALADHVGNDTQSALQEINKLLTYVDLARPVELEDVELLTAPGGQVNIFEMVDGLADGNTNRAMRLLVGLLDETDPFSLFGMIVRQFRLLIQAREALDQGDSVERVARELHIPDFVARKLANQAGHFSMERLRAIYHRLLELDEGTKTGQWPAELALEMLVAELKT